MSRYIYIYVYIDRHCTYVCNDVDECMICIATFFLDYFFLAKQKRMTASCDRSLRIMGVSREIIPDWWHKNSDSWSITQNIVALGRDQCTWMFRCASDWYKFWPTSTVPTCFFWRTDKTVEVYEGPEMVINLKRKDRCNTFWTATISDFATLLRGVTWDWV